MLLHQFNILTTCGFLGEAFVGETFFVALAGRPRPFLPPLAAAGFFPTLALGAGVSAGAYNFQFLILIAFIIFNKITYFSGSFNFSWTSTTHFL